MKKKIRCISVLLSAVGSISTTFASEQYTLNVGVFGAYGNGAVFVTFDKTIVESGCSRETLELAAGSPAASYVLATASVAKSTGKMVVVKTNGCQNGNPTLTNARDGYFHIAN